MSIDIAPRHLKIVHEILKQYLNEHQVCVFGSRARMSKAKKTSDLDLCVKGETELSFELLANLRNDFSESNLPYKVDVVDWYSMSASFKKL